MSKLPHRLHRTRRREKLMCDSERGANRSNRDPHNRQLYVSVKEKCFEKVHDT